MFVVPSGTGGQDGDASPGPRRPQIGARNTGMAQIHPADPSGHQIQLVHGRQEVVLVELGAGLRTYTVDGEDVVDGFGRDEMSGGSRGHLLVPWPNRIEGGRYDFAGQTYQLPLNEPAVGTAIHGLVAWVPWAFVQLSDTEAEFTFRLYPQPGYPFSLDLDVRYSLGESGLTVRMGATNIGASPCPYGAGAHPYLRLGDGLIDGLELRLPATEHFLANEMLIPTGKASVGGTGFDFTTPRPIGATQLDTCFGGITRDQDGRARAHLSDGGYRHVALWFDQPFDYLMVYTGDSLHDPANRRRGLALEPMTCAPNAFRSGDGLVVLEPGQHSTSLWGIEPRFR
jgi:aldose 1-epimerase